MLRWILPLFLLLGPCLGHAWLDSGHLIVSEVAYANLDPKTKQRVDELSENFSKFYPKTSSFITAAIWADDIKEHLPLFDQLHFIDMPYDPDHVLTREQKNQILDSNENHVVWLIKKAQATLTNPQANDFEKGLMLRLLIHCVGDIHQPVHCTTLYSKKHPHGDMGGNKFYLKSKYKNLHFLWDSGGGAFSEKRYALEPFSCSEMAKELMELYPQKAFKQLRSKTPQRWARESHDLAIQVAYQIKERTVPSEEYLEKVRETSRKQVTLAGYRLAQWLNSHEI